MAADVPRSPVLIAEAVLLILLGIGAIVLPLAAGLAVSLVVGIILLISGAVGLFSAFSGGAHVHRGWSVLSAVIALVVGLLILFNPLVGAAALTLLLGVYLLLDGISLIGLAVDQRKRGVKRWALLLVSGLIDLGLAALIVFTGAIGSAVIIGLIVGLDLIAAGAALLILHRSPLVGGMARPA